MIAGSHPDIKGYTYQKELGSGGFADVYLYHRTSPDRLVAIKVLRATDFTERQIKHFMAEADAMAALIHPYIAQVFSAGLVSDGRPYIEMAYYPYGNLVDRLRQAPFTVPEVLRIGVQLCSAIETAHRLNPPLLHRDIKPSNVLIDEYGDPVLTDFGIASRINAQDEDDISLSVGWAPPEVMFATSKADERSDVYSLGALLWTLLAGHAPFVIPGGDNRPATTMARTRDDPVPQTGRPDVPTSLERLLSQAMNKNPSLRPATAEELARGLNTVEQDTYGFGQVTPFKVRIDPAVRYRDHRVNPSVVSEMTRLKSPADGDAVVVEIADAHGIQNVATQTLVDEQKPTIPLHSSETATLLAPQQTTPNPPTPDDKANGDQLESYRYGPPHGHLSGVPASSHNQTEQVPFRKGKWFLQSVVWVFVVVLVIALILVGIAVS